jgi:hypothetical protein
VGERLCVDQPELHLDLPSGSAKGEPPPTPADRQALIMSTLPCGQDVAYVHDVGSGDFAMRAAPGLLRLLQRWTPRGDVHRLSPGEFLAFATPGTARAAWGFRIDAVGGGTELSTETRIACVDRRSRNLFRWYWMVIGPFSGLIRRQALRLIRQTPKQACSATISCRPRLPNVALHCRTHLLKLGRLLRNARATSRAPRCSTSTR